GRPFVRRLHNERQSQAIRSGIQPGLVIQHDIVGRRQTFLEPHLLGHDLVHRQAGCQWAAARVGQVHQLEHALQRTVLAIASVQRDEYAVETGIEQIGQRTGAGIEQVGVHPGTAQRLVHAASRHQRDLALGGASAIQHPHAAKPAAHANSPIRAGTRLMVPAPMTMTTSPSSTKSSMDAAMSATSSMNTGSTRPATRMARASARPSAATSGDSPAAYTSLSNTASAWLRTRTKSSKQSRVRV